MRPTKDGRGQYLFLELDILEGQFAGRKLFDRLNLVNDNPDTVDIATRTLSSICRATGQMQVKDSEQLHLIPLIADVRVRPPKGQYGESNSIRYLPRNAAAPAPATRAPAAYASAPAPATALAPQPARPVAPAAPAAPVVPPPVVCPGSARRKETTAMTELHSQSATAALPDTPEGCRARLATLQSEIAAIRVQIATADLRRQAHKQALDAEWFHRAKTALRLKREEAARLSARLIELTPKALSSRASSRERFKDALIEAMRAECDDARWAALLQRARLLHDHQEVSNG